MFKTKKSSQRNMKKLEPMGMEKGLLLGPSTGRDLGLEVLLVFAEHV